MIRDGSLCGNCYGCTSAFYGFTRADCLLKQTNDKMIETTKNEICEIRDERPQIIDLIDKLIEEIHIQNETLQTMVNEHCR